jgi:hypothetical protein
VYEGNFFVNGKITGKGKVTFTNGDMYECDFVTGNMHGKGKYIWKSGAYQYVTVENNKLVS